MVGGWAASITLTRVARSRCQGLTEIELWTQIGSIWCAAEAAITDKVYHSHPRGTVEMSRIDRDRALDPDWVYLVCDPTSGDLAAWSSEGQRLEILRNQTGPGGNY